MRISDWSSDVALPISIEAEEPNMPDEPRETEKIRKSDKEWMRQLTPEQFRVCRLKGTERPFTGKYDACKDKGTYVCACCGNPLFRSEAKFDSGTGWPSFFEPLAPGAEIGRASCRERVC